MSFEIVSASELDILLSSYVTYKDERYQEEPPFLQLLDWIEQKQTDQTIAERICQPGEIILREDEPGDIFYVIRSGQTAIIKGDFQNPTILGFRGSGDPIGEMALLENLPRSATVVALNTVSLWSLSRAMFYQFVGGEPSIIQFGINEYAQFENTQCG